MSKLRVSLITFNCGKSLIDPHFFALNLLKQNKTPDLIVVSLQEVAPLAYSLLGASYLHPYLRRVWKAVKLACTDLEQYGLLQVRNIGTTAIMLFATQDARSRIGRIEVGYTAVGDYGLSNKGAVGVRLAYNVDGNTIRTLCFVAAHLAPMETEVRRRNKDWEDISKTLVFEPTGSKPHTAVLDESSLPLMDDTLDIMFSGPSSGIYEPGTLLFLAGDLNYRTHDASPNTGDYMTFPQPSSDLEPWRRRDQLTKERNAGRTLHNLSEPSLFFPPTYKYASRRNGSQWPQDGSEPTEWLWAKNRFPSWCDRILFSSSFATTNALTVSRYTALPLLNSDHRPVVMDVEIDLLSPCWQSALRLKSPFKIDPAWRSRRESSQKVDLVVGLIAYLVSTWEGNGILIASIIGAFGGYAVLSSLLVN